MGSRWVELFFNQFEPVPVRILDERYLMGANFQREWFHRYCNALSAQAIYGCFQAFHAEGDVVKAVAFNELFLISPAGELNSIPIFIFYERNFCIVLFDLESACQLQPQTVSIENDRLLQVHHIQASVQDSQATHDTTFRYRLICIMHRYQSRASTFVGETGEVFHCSCRIWASCSGSMLPPVRISAAFFPLS